MQQELTNWMIDQIESRTGKKRESIDLNHPFSECGLDSLDAFEILGLLERKLNIRIDQSRLLQIPTIQALIDYLSVQPRT